MVPDINKIVKLLTFREFFPVVLNLRPEITSSKQDDAHLTIKNMKIKTFLLIKSVKNATSKQKFLGFSRMTRIFLSKTRKSKPFCGPHTQKVPRQGSCFFRFLGIDPKSHRSTTQWAINERSPPKFKNFKFSLLFAYQKGIALI